MIALHFLMVAAMPLLMSIRDCVRTVMLMSMISVRKANDDRYRAGTRVLMVRLMLHRLNTVCAQG